MARHPIVHLRPTFHLRAWSSSEAPGWNHIATCSPELDLYPGNRLLPTQVADQNHRSVVKLVRHDVEIPVVLKVEDRFPRARAPKLPPARSDYCATNLCPLSSPVRSNKTTAPPSAHPAAAHPKNVFAVLSASYIVQQQAVHPAKGKFMLAAINTSTSRPR